MKLRSKPLLIAMIFGGSLATTVPASAQSYTAFDIGTLGGRGTYATAINATGQVTGNSYTSDFGPHHAFVTEANGRGMTDLGTLPGGNISLGFGINASGQVTGEAEYHISEAPGTHPLPRAFIADATSGMRLVTNQDFSHGRGINNAGQVAGFVSSASGTGVFITGPNGENIRGLSNLGSYYDTATDINTAGQVVGGARISSSSYNHAYITGPDQGYATDLGTLGGDTSTAHGVNDSGQIVGYSEITRTFQSPIHAFITDINSNMTDLGTLGGQNSQAFDINSDGQVVGWAETSIANRRHAFLTGPDGEGMTDLNSLVTLENGVYLASANGISDIGQIIANASDGRAYLLSPIPEPETYAMFLTGLGLMGFMARRRKQIS